MSGPVGAWGKGGGASTGFVHAVPEVGGERLGVRLAKWLQKAVEDCEDLPLARLLRPFGVTLRAEAAGGAPVLGLKLGGGGGEAKVANVYDEGPAQAGGVAVAPFLGFSYFRLRRRFHVSAGR